MESTKVSDEEIVRRLRRHPQIRSRVAELLAVEEDSNGDLRRADDAEVRLIEEMRSLGRAAMQSWAQGQVIQREREVRQSGRAHREGKKTSLAHHLRRHKRAGAAIPQRQQEDTPLCPKRGRQR